MVGRWWSVVKRNRASANFEVQLGSIAIVAIRWRLRNDAAQLDSDRFRKILHRTGGSC
jgi:hypothetical protein